MNTDNKSKSDVITTLKLSSETKMRIDKLRSYRRESYEDILKKLLEILNLCRTSPEKAKIELLRIDRLRNQLA